MFLGSDIYIKLLPKAMLGHFVVLKKNNDVRTLYWFYPENIYTFTLTPQTCLGIPMYEYIWLT